MEFNQTTLESYNKELANGNEAQGTLIGNWWEEQQLRTATGIGRTAHHLGKNHKETATRSVTDTGLVDLLQQEPTNNTNERCLGRKRNLIPNTVNSEYGKGFNKADTLSKVGPKYVNNQQQMLQLIKSELNEQERLKEEQRNARSFQTTTQIEFGTKEHAMAGCTVGRRVMRTQNGQPIPPNNRDEDLLVDHGFLERQPYLTDEELKQQLPQGESYLTQQHVTVWKEKQDDGFGCVYQSVHDPNDPKASFYLNNKFVKTFHDYSHVKK